MSYRTMDIYIKPYFFGEHPMSPPNKKRRIEALTDEEPILLADDKTNVTKMPNFNHELLIEKLSKLQVF